MVPSQDIYSKVILTPPSNLEILTNPNIKNKKRKYNKKAKKKQKNESPPTSKRNSCPGVRIRGGRIFDSQNGKTCHQCRQKTMDFVAVCKRQIDEKRCCSIKFCHKCLLNRYGEKAEEAERLENWKCPKCRGICNCSFCMKKKGHQPTGILVHTAKATGFQSVLDMLVVTGPDNFNGSRRKEKVAEGEESLSSPSDVKKKRKYKRKQFEESNRDGNVDKGKKRSKKDNVRCEIDLNITLNEEEMKSERSDGGDMMRMIKRREFKRLARANRYVNEQDNGAYSEKNREGLCESIETSLNSIYEGEKMNETAGVDKKPQNCSNICLDLIKALHKIAHSKDSQNCISEGNSTELIKKEEEPDETDMSFHACDKNSGIDNLGGKTMLITNYRHKNEPDAGTSLHQNMNLTTIADIELPAEDVLQFLEFCNAFGQSKVHVRFPRNEVISADDLFGGTPQRKRVFKGLWTSKFT
ncbi:hypothetical protein IFM89_004422 [Coptis chinensis]|uniref:Zinc-finger domain-containing protein n=1 Tax=Coptis chinensis TaxID=261450 RepID=A0A835IKV8_9MAGN|nr:hypothetical protein IFM89_004422 [Coptis chinensis]